MRRRLRKRQELQQKNAVASRVDYHVFVIKSIKKTWVFISFFCFDKMQNKT